MENLARPVYLFSSAGYIRTFDLGKNVIENSRLLLIKYTFVYIEKIDMLFVLKHSILYYRFALKMFFQTGNFSVIYVAIRCYSLWMKDFKSGETTVSRRMPWINYLAKDYLDTLVRKDMLVFEWGSGGSTLYWADHCDKLISVEHEKKWYELLSEVLVKEKTMNVEYKNILPESISKILDYHNHKNFASRDLVQCSFHEYVNVISVFPDNYFDFIVVDGRARNACLNAALYKIKTGGIIMLDNSDRKYYAREFSQLLKDQGWEQKRFIGPVPFQHAFCETTFFTKK